jgi:tRNA modification GTPase
VAGRRETIFALSSGALPAGIAVIRLSGPAAGTTLESLCGPLPEARRLALRPVNLSGEQVDEALCTWFPAPGSFTGEDCAELHLHGSPALVRRVLRWLAEQPSLRHARAGEFTQRAFEAGRLDLVSADGLADLLASETESQRQQAQARLSGALTQRIDGWRDLLLDLRAELESLLDFSDEGDVPEAISSEFIARLSQLESELASAVSSHAAGRIVREGLRIAIAGAPNAGKSSLINALSNSEVAIVSAEPGTTRDVREVQLDIGGQLVVLLDTAGLRETGSLAEAEGVRRARAAIETANLVLWLIAPDITDAEPPPSGPDILLVHSKSDLAAYRGDGLSISTNAPGGVAPLLKRLTGEIEQRTGSGPVLVSHERDREALITALSSVRDCAKRLEQPELAAALLQNASMALDRLTGRIDAEMVLDRLFSRFCIGK